MFALMLVVMANAQTVVRNGVFSNMYIGINAGANQTTVSNYTNRNKGFTNGLKTLTYNAGIELGKDVTPITGFSLQGNVAPIYHNDLNMNPEWKINRSDLFGNVKFNMMNLFGGYKGYPRRVEVKTVTGIGWNHYFKTSDEQPKNDLALQAGLEFDFNLGKNRAWYITFVPMVQANQILKAEEIQYLWTGGPDEDKAADLKVNVGIAYRFGSNKTGSHNFVICPNMYTEDEYQELYQQYEDCLARPVETKVDTVVVEKVVEVEKIVEGNDTNGVINFITFEKGSSKISNVQMETLNLIMNSMNKEDSIKVIGSADTQTGNEEINTKLATQRAEAVKAVLEKNGFTVTDTVIKLDAFDGGEISRCAIVTKK